MNNVELNPSLWLYAIHSKNAELIQILESNGVGFPGGNYIKCLIESIKCHHNSIADYFKENYDCLNEEEYIKDNDNDNEKIFDKVLKYHNYSYFPSDFAFGYELFYSCFYDYHTLVDLFMKRNEKNILVKVKNKDEIDVIYFLLMKQAKIDDNYFCREKLTKIAIPPSITSIGSYAFSKCSLLTQIAISSSVTKIGDSAFDGCSLLAQITIPSSVTSIQSSTFSKCSSLKQITIPSSVTEIGDYALRGCSSLTQITIPSSVTEIRWNIFDGCSSLTQIIIPSSVTSIGSYAFRGCSSLTQITIPSSVTSIGDYAFSGCSSLTQITIPSSVTKFGEKIFNRIKILQLIGTINSIPNRMFCGCSSLTQIAIPSSVTEIGSYSFCECSSLTKNLISCIFKLFIIK